LRFPPFPSRGGVVTNKAIDALRDEDAYWKRALVDANVLIALLDTDRSRSW